MLDDKDTIDQIIVRREALASVEAAEATDLLAYVDRAREAGELLYGEAHGRRRVDAAIGWRGFCHPADAWVTSADARVMNAR